MTIMDLLEELGTSYANDLAEIELADENGPTPEGDVVLDTKIGTPVGRIAAAILLIGNGNCKALGAVADLILG